jgi:hypothetical protein
LVRAIVADAPLVASSQRLTTLTRINWKAGR